MKLLNIMSAAFFIMTLATSVEARKDYPALHPKDKNGNVTNVPPPDLDPNKCIAMQFNGTAYICYEKGDEASVPKRPSYDPDTGATK